MGGRGKIRSSSRGRRRGKRSVKLIKKGQEDRISELSDDLINHILSYVHSRDAVKTMILSKRWVNLWRTLSCFTYKPHILGTLQQIKQLRLFATTRNLIIRDLIGNLIIRDFVDFVGNFFENRDQQYVLSKFTIDCYFGGREMLAICLDCALSHNVEHLSIREGDLAHCPYLINFACLKTLHLISCENSQPMKLCWRLPSLTSLHLEKVRIGKQIILRFEHLKELTLVEILRKEADDMNITINCPKLQSLTLYPDFRHTFIVSTPSLSYLKYCSRHVSAFSSIDGFPCIKRVHIDIRKNNGDFFDLSDWPNGTVRKLAMQNFVSMLKAVRETPFLELSSETIKGLRMIPNLSEYKHSSLGNLKFISLRGPGLFDMRPPRTTDYVINYLLTNSPCVKIIRKL